MIFIDFHHQHYRGFLQTQYLTTTCFRMIRMSTFSTCWLNQQQRNGANRKSNWQTIEVKAALYQYVPMIYLYHRLEMVGACWSNPVLLTLVHSSSCEQHQSPPALAKSPAFWFSSKISARATQYLQGPLPWRLSVDSGGSQTAMGSDHCRDSHPLWMTGWWLTYPEKYESQLGRIIPYIIEQ